MDLDPKISDIVFFSSDHDSIGSKEADPGGCEVLTLGQFQIFKMAADIVKSPIYSNICVFL